MFPRFLPGSFFHGGESHVLVHSALVGKWNGGVNRPVVRIDIFFVADLEG